MATATYTIYKRVQSAGKWRYRKAAIHTNGKIKPNIVIVDGKEEKHDGTYYLAHDGKWIGVGNDALEAQRKRGEYLTHSEYARLHAASNVVPITAPQTERKLIQTEVDAYLANLELAKRVKKSVSDKRKFLTAFITIAGKKYVDEYDRDDVLRFRNRRMKDYEPKSVDTQMMCVVTFFNKWLKIKLGMEKSDWPEVKIPAPEPFSREEIVAMEKHSTGKINLRHTRPACRLSFPCMDRGIGMAVRVKSLRISKQFLDFHSKPGRERLRGGILRKNERET
jgi:integrase/recombinase XerD